MRHLIAASAFALAFLAPVSGEAALLTHTKKQQASVARADSFGKDTRKIVP